MSDNLQDSRRLAELLKSKGVPAFVGSDWHWIEHHTENYLWHFSPRVVIDGIYQGVCVQSENYGSCSTGWINIGDLTKVEESLKLLPQNPSEGEIWECFE